MAKHYVVRQGDTLIGIAARECNNAITWQQIAADNQLDDPNVISVGQVLILNYGDEDEPGEFAVGVDASYAQATVDWALLRSQGVRFALVKASEGAQNTDNQFHANWNGLRVNGILRGAYHYFRALQDARAQADRVLSLVTLEANDLQLSVDVEEVGNKTATPAQWANGLRIWLEEVEERTGRTPMIYTRASFWNDLHLPSDFSRYRLWVANWRNPNTQPILPRGWSDWTFWQYSSPPSGIFDKHPFSKKFDVDFFHGTCDELLSFIQPAQPI